MVKFAADRAGFIWYNIEPGRGVHRRDLNPELNEQQNTLVQSMDVDLDDTPSAATDSVYAGIMRGFPSGGVDISQGQLLELWVNDFKPDPLTRGGKIHIDLGLIDENFHVPDNPGFDDEDKNHDGFAPTIDDTGFDGLFDTDEPGASIDNPDPNGDDLDLHRDAVTTRYEKINGTEANLLHDTEDLDRDGQFDRTNAYFSYAIPLADSAAVDIRRDFPGYDGFDEPGHENDSWRLYRIKVSDYLVHAPGPVQPDLHKIRHVRIWFDDLSSVVPTSGEGARRIQFARFSIKP